MKKFGIALLVVMTGCVTVNEGGEDGKDGTDGAAGESGVVAKRKATDFTAAEKSTFCDWLATESKESAGDYTCGEIDVEIVEISLSSCEALLAANPNCETSVIEACGTAVYKDPCLLASNSAPAACAALDQCAEDITNNGVSTDNGVATNNGSTEEFCYEHTVNDVTTGKQCFSTKTAYCESLCNETNFLSEDACAAEC